MESAGVSEITEIDEALLRLLWFMGCNATSADTLPPS